MYAQDFEALAAVAEMAGGTVERDHLPGKTAGEDGSVTGVTFSMEQLSQFAEMIARGQSEVEFMDHVGRTLANERAGILSVDVSFGEIPEIAAFLNSVQSCDERTMKMRMAELRALEMPRGAWNVFGIAARVALLKHGAYGEVLGAIQEKGGI